MGLRIEAPKQDGNARFNTLKVNLQQNLSATRGVVADDQGNFYYGVAGGGAGFPFTGSAEITGSLGVTGSINVTNGSITGSLYGTSSWAVSASYVANTPLAETASYVTSSNVHGPFGANSILSSSYSVSSSYSETASYAVYAETASFVTASSVFGPFGSSSIESASYAASASIALTASFSPNIYNSDGELSGNRYMSGSQYTLTLEPTLTLKNSIYGINRKTSFNQDTNTTSSISASLVVYGDAVNNSEAFKLIYGTYNLVYGVNNATGSGFMGVNGLISYPYISGTTLTNRILAQGAVIFATRRGISGSNDISENGANALTGIYAGASFLGGPYASTSSYLSTQTGIFVSNATTTGRVGSLYGIRIFDNITHYVDSTVSGSIITNYYGIRLQSTIGTTSGPTASIQNYYSIRISPPTIGATGTISSLYGIYAEDNRMSHYYAGNVSIGTTTTGSYKLHVIGNTGISGSLTATGSVLFPSLTQVSQNNIVTIDPITGQLYYTASSGLVPTTAATASFVTSSNVYGPYGFDSIQTASHALSLPSNINITASNILVTSNLQVEGTASFNYVEQITGSAVIVGQEYIILNTQTPTARFAGLIVYDSGSNATASIVWDSERNHLVYQNTSGSGYTGGGFLSGPRNTGSLGQEPYPTFNRVVRGQGGDHLYDSNIIDDDTKVSIGINTQVTGSLIVSSGITGSLFGTASWAENFFTSSVTSASYAFTASSAVNSFNAVSASYALTASSAINSFTATSASYALTASSAIDSFTATSASYALTASSAINSISSSYLSGSSAIITNLTSSLDAQINGLNFGRGAGSQISNVSVGAQNLRANTTGIQNTAVGLNSLDKVTTGTRNTAIGANTLNANVTGQYNVALGVGSINNVSDGDYNIGVGYVAGSSFRTGSRNIFLGAATNASQPGIVTGSFNVIIGTGISGLPSTTSNNIVLADGQGNIRAWHNATSWSLFTPVVANQGITGSLFGTASWAQNFFTSSVTSASYALTASSAINSFASITSSYALTASSADNFTVRGTLIAQTIVAQVITASTEYITGSTVFGSLLSNTHDFTGSVRITGSLNVKGPATITDLTGSLFGTASWAQNFFTSSVTSASYAFTASSAVNSFNAVSASYALTASSAINSFAAISASYSLTASSAVNSFNAVSASYAVTASSAVNSFNATSASYALTSSVTNTANRALTASYVDPLYQTVYVSGSVGIGTSTPTQKLELYDGAVAITLTPQTYGGSYRTSLGSRASAEGHLVLGNNAANYIQAGTSATGGTLSIYVNSTNAVNSPVNGTMAMYFKADGNIGIGTTAPGAKLEVHNGDIWLNAASSAVNPEIRFIDDSGISVAGAKIRYGNSDGNLYIEHVWDTTTSGIFFRNRTGGTALNTLSLVNGSVGINTTSPAGRLHIADDSQTALVIGSSTVSYIGETDDGSFPGMKINPYNANIHFGISSTNNTKLNLWHGGSNYSYWQQTATYAVLTNYFTSALVLQVNGGNVGIATTAPNEKLHVAGNIHAYAAGGINAGLLASTSGGSTTVYINSSGFSYLNGGNVGIGTSTPNDLLHVNGGGIITTGVGGGGSYNSLYVSTSNTDARNWSVGASISAFGDFGIKQSNAKDGNPISAGTTRFYITNLGNIGIGTTTVTQAKLQVEGNVWAQSFTGSLFGTASWAQNFLTSSVTSASYAATASSADNFLVRQNITASNALITGAITAQTLIVSTVSSSVVYSSGSNIFGNQLTNVQQFTGSLRVTGSGNHWIMGSSVGIGTTAPSIRFTVAGTATETTALFGQGSSNQTYIAVGGAAATDSAGFLGYDFTGNYVGLVVGGDALGTGINVKRGGSIGIGITTPSQKLEVVGNGLIGPANGKMFIGDVGHGTTYPAIAHQDYATTTGYALLIPSNGYLFLNKRDVAGTYIGFRKNNADLVIIDNNGNVGIATTSPGDKLEVVGNVYADAFNSVGTLSRYATNGGIAIAGLAGTGYAYISAYSNSGGVGKNLALQKDGGNVGIGTITPTSLLHVNGAASASSYTGAAYYGTAYSAFTDAGGGLAYFDTVTTSGARLYEIAIVANPNSAGSGAYKDFFYGKIIIGTGWNGSAVTDYITYVQESPDPRSLYTSGGGTLTVVARLVSGGVEYDSLPSGTTYTIRVKISGYVTAGASTTVRLKQIM